MTYDIEVVENSLLSLVKQHLPAKLSEIEAEKADGVLLPAPTDDQYYTGTDIDEKVVNYDFIVIHGVGHQGAISISSATAQDNIYGFVFLFSEQNAPSGELRKKILRYSRAIKEVFEYHFDAFPFLSNLKIYMLAPENWQENDKSPVYKAGGAFIETVLAS